MESVFFGENRECGVTFVNAQHTLEVKVIKSTLLAYFMLNAVQLLKVDLCILFEDTSANCRLR